MKFLIHNIRENIFSIHFDQFQFFHFRTILVQDFDILLGWLIIVNPGGSMEGFEQP